MIVYPEGCFYSEVKVDVREFKFSSADIKTLLEGVPLSEPSVINWVEGYISEQTEQLFKN